MKQKKIKCVAHRCEILEWNLSSWLACRQTIIICSCFRNVFSVITCVASESFVAPGNQYFYLFNMAGTGRQFFNESENICLQELIVKYKLNSMATTLGSSAAKNISWARLTEEYNL